jgi:cytidylate kinase
MKETANFHNHLSIIELCAFDRVRKAKKACRMARVRWSNLFVHERLTWRTIQQRTNREAAMKQTAASSLNDHARPIMGAIRTVSMKPGALKPTSVPVLPFVTIARQPGIDAEMIAAKLVEALNISDHGEVPWTCWDRELVEKIATTHHLDKALIDKLDESSHSWLLDMLSSLSFTDTSGSADEERVYSRVKTTIRALAQAGRVVIVGRAGVLITRDLPWGVHINLVAPMRDRVEAYAKRMEIIPERAVAHIREREQNRQAFYKRHWPKDLVQAETFTLTINTHGISSDAVVKLIETAAHIAVPQPAIAQ